MQMLILCGGLGTRLRPLTEDIPKPMLVFDNKPFLQYLIEYYKGQGINEFVLSVGYLKEKIIQNSMTTLKNYNLFLLHFSV